MGSRALFMLRATSSPSPLLNITSIYKSSLLFSKKAFIIKSTVRRSYTVRSSLDPPDLNRLAQTSRISLTPDEIEEFAPKIQQVAALKKINAIGTGDDLLTWFGQLQGVDLQSVRPSIRADFEGQNMRDDLPETFGNREQMIAAVPNFEDPFIKVPKVLNKE